MSSFGGRCPANEPTSFFLEDPSRAGRYGDEAIPQGISAATRPTLTFGMLAEGMGGMRASALGLCLYFVLGLVLLLRMKRQEFPGA